MAKKENDEGRMHLPRRLGGRAPRVEEREHPDEPVLGARARAELEGRGADAHEFFVSSRRRHTRWTGDWSSDVCSSDLQRRGLFGERIAIGDLRRTSTA